MPMVVPEPLTVTLTEPAAITATETHKPIACNGGTSTVTISATGGTAPYTRHRIFTQSVGTVVYRYDAMVVPEPLPLLLLSLQRLLQQKTHHDCM